MSASMSRFLGTYCRLSCQSAPRHLALIHRRTKATTKKTPKKMELRLQPPRFSIWETPRCLEQQYSLPAALAMHREFAQPAMLDNPDGFLYAEMLLSMTTKKQTKFMPSVTGLLKLPHKFNHGTTKEIAVFCTTEDEKDTAVNLGATFVGDTELVKMITNLQIGPGEIDDIAFFLCTPEMAKAVLKLRPYLKQKTPTVANGLVSADIGGLFKELSTQVAYESRRLTEAVGKLQVPFGKMSQSELQLTDNFTTMVSLLSELKAPKLDPLIQKVSIIAPPSPEIFQLKVEQYVTGHTVADTAETSENTAEPSLAQQVA